MDQYAEFAGFHLKLYLWASPKKAKFRSKIKIQKIQKSQQMGDIVYGQSPEKTVFRVNWLYILKAQIPVGG